jgi:thiamine transport system permease protein
LEKIASKRKCSQAYYSVSVIFFFFAIFLPPIFVLYYAFLGWNEIARSVISNSTVYSEIIGATTLSFETAGLVTVLDVVLGVPMAWIIARGKFAGKRWIDSLVDIPLSVPTSALGFSTGIFWGGSMFLERDLYIGQLFWKGLFSKGIYLIILLHVAFTFPYVVRGLVAAIEQIDLTHEIAARTLGAAPYTVFRTISLPLFRAGLLVGALLSFARSLSETGATMMVSGLYKTAPVLIVDWRAKGTAGIPAAAFISLLLIATAWILLILVRTLSREIRVPFFKVWPNAERILSSRKPRLLRDGATITFFIIFIIIPSIFIFAYAIWGGASLAPGSQGKTVSWPAFWNSLLLSFEVASLVTLANLLLGLPVAISIARKKLGILSGILEKLTDVPLVVPTSALGYSLFLFWGTFIGLKGFDIPALTMAHLSFTYPYIVKTIATSLQGLDPTYEDVARTLGANPLKVFRTVTFPLTKSGFLAGAVMAFTRSLSETGATMAVAVETKTAPVLIVEWVKYQALADAGWACIVLITISYLIMLLFRYATSRIGVAERR